MRKKVDVIILAGGMLGKKKLFPKALMEIQGRTLLERQLEWLSPYANKIIVACTDSEAREIKKHFKKLVFATTPVLPGTAGSLKKAFEFVTTDEALVVNVDDLTNINLAGLLDFGPDTICVANPRLHYGMIEIDGHDIKSFREKPRLNNIWVSCGVYLLRKEIAKKLPKKGNIARDVFPYLKLRAYKHLGDWQTISENHQH